MNARILTLVALVFAGSEAFGAVPRSLTPAATAERKHGLIREALKLPLENRLQALRSQGSEAASALNVLIFDRQQPLEVRWRSLTALPHLNQALGQAAVEKALASDEWYLRNAATLALPALPRAKAVELSSKLLSDPALVIRTAAAQNLLKLNAKEKEWLLWEKLSASENFRNGESLWIRRHLARALAEIAASGTEAKFVGLLNDRDHRLHPFAIKGLERLTGRKVGTRVQWLAWAEGKKVSRN